MVQLDCIFYLFLHVCACVGTVSHVPVVCVGCLCVPAFSIVLA